MQLVVFDLDYTVRMFYFFEEDMYSELMRSLFQVQYTPNEYAKIWQPEMYQLDGPPKLISVDEFVGKQKRKARTAPRPIPSGSRTIQQNKIYPCQVWRYHLFKNVNI